MAVTQEESMQMIENFLSENGLWFSFVEHLDEREGHKPTDLGFQSDD